MSSKHFLSFENQDGSIRNDSKSFGIIRNDFKTFKKIQNSFFLDSERGKNKFEIP